MPVRPSYPSRAVVQLVIALAVLAMPSYCCAQATAPPADTVTPAQPNTTPVETPEETPPTGEPAEPQKDEPAKLPAPTNAKRLHPKYDAWIDKEKGIVIVDGKVSLTEGQLEMFACPIGTKEHESIVGCNTKAFVIHAGLLAVGAEPGKPVHFDQLGRHFPPTGTEIEITVYWLDKDGNRKRALAQEWIRDINTNKQMKLPWVFAGSQFWKDEDTGENIYLAESGDFICVSNFSSAMLDVPAESTPSNDGLAFEAFTDRIPPVDTPVRLVLKPKLKKKDATDKPKPAAE